MLHNAIASGFIKSRFGGTANYILGTRLTKISKRFTVRIADVHCYPQPIQKTHDLYSEEAAQSVKYVFVYGDPLDSARSVETMVEKYGEDWLKQHLHHLNSSGSLDELYCKDILNFEAQMDSWMNAPRASVLAIKFDDLWNKASEISQFVGFDVTLPAREERSKKPDLRQHDEELFSRLRRLMSAYHATRGSQARPRGLK